MIMGLTWKDLSPIFARLGMPVLAWMLDKLPAIAGEAVKGLPFGGFLSGAVEKTARALLSQVIKALGLDPETAQPDDVKAAIEGGNTTDVVSRLQEIEAKAAHTTALVELFKSDNETDVEMAKVNSETYLANRRAEAGTNDYWASFYRTILMYGLTFALLYLIGIVLYAITAGGAIVDSIAKMETVVIGMFGTLLSVLVGHFVTRASERKAFLAPTLPTPAASTSTTVVVPAPAAKPKAAAVKK